MTRAIEVNGQPFAVLVESSTNGTYLVPPIVLDEDGAPIEGHEILQAIVESGFGITMPVIRNANPGVLAWVDRTMAMLSFSLQAPILLEDS